MRIKKLPDSMVESGNFDHEEDCITNRGGGEVVCSVHSRAFEGDLMEWRIRHMPKSVAPTAKIPKASAICITSIAIDFSLQQNVTRIHRTVAFSMA